MPKTVGGTLLIALSLAVACRQPQSTEPARQPEAPYVQTDDLKRLEGMIRRFAPVDLTADVGRLPSNERDALAILVNAAKILDALFLRQVWEENESLMIELAKDASPLGQARMHYFLINKGPWSRLDHNEPFILGVPKKPERGNFYPANAKKEQVEQWINRLPDAERRRATGFFTTIRTDGQGNFVIVPYNLEYQNELARVAVLLRQAAALTAQPTLKNYLDKRAAALQSNDYYDSDVAWMELDASIEPTIGPYEVYEDEWFNYKAAFEAFITLRDDAETQKLARFSGELQEIENNLPIDPKYRNPKLGALAPIRVVNTVFSSGDANRGVQTAAFNLPNDERVTAEKGSKRVMLKNNQEAKFRMVLQPISKVALSAADQQNVSFEAFFTHILMHELMHGLGPHNITVNGRATTVRQEMKELSSAIEEAKADVSGLFALQFLVDRGKLDKAFDRTMYTTYLASMFRSIRFGINEAHGRGVALQLNYFLDNGGVKVAADGTFTVDAPRIRQNVVDLTRDIMTIQAVGDYAAAKQMIDKLVSIRPPVQAVLDKLKDVPVDIEPRFVTANELLSKSN
ncbi:MAG: dipeptidyl-peptidase 3 family protein [Vicinamibacterales bacterium]